MKRWVEEDWNNIIFHNPLTPKFSDIFYADVRRVQQTHDVKQWLHKCKITMNLNIRDQSQARSSIVHSPGFICGEIWC